MLHCCIILEVIKASFPLFHLKQELLEGMAGVREAPLERIRPRLGAPAAAAVL